MAVTHAEILACASRDFAGNPFRRSPPSSSAADRVADALLHVAGLCGTGEVLLLGVRLAGRGRILLAFRHEALERGAGELLVRGLRLASCESGRRRDQADGECQYDFSHSLLP